jgi:hypothetical protein
MRSGYDGASFKRSPVRAEPFVLSHRDPGEVIMRRAGLSLSIVLVLVCGIAAPAIADPIHVGVSFTTTGTPGDYELDFTVHNNMLAWPGQNVYFFGVSLGARDIAGSPGTFNPDMWLTWDNTPYGGSSTIYNNVWIGGSITPGTSLSGFKVHITDLVAPTSVPWFMFSVGSPDYTGGDNFNNGYNPGFEGDQPLIAAVPEPTSLALAGIGALSLLACRARRRRLAV